MAKMVNGCRGLIYGQTKKRHHAILDERVDCRVVGEVEGDWIGERRDGEDDVPSRRPYSHEWQVQPLPVVDEGRDASGGRDENTQEPQEHEA